MRNFRGWAAFLVISILLGILVTGCVRHSAKMGIVNSCERYGTFTLGKTYNCEVKND
jgi:hypothetical protein